MKDIAANIEEEENKKTQTSSKIKTNGNSEVNVALREKLAQRRGKVRKSIRSVIGEE